jgi:hypothetical protein
MVCPAPSAHGMATCEGACEIACDSPYRACGNNCYKLSDTDHCGTDCKKCAAPANAKATCDGTSCGTACLHATLSCSGSSSACGSWNFESGSPEGFTLIPSPETSADDFGENTKQAAEGSYSLAIGFAAQLGMKVGLCPGGAVTTDIRDLKFSAQLYIEGPALPVADDNFVQMYVNTAAGDQLGAELAKLETGKWQTISATLSPPTIMNLDTASSLTFYVRLYQTSAPGWTGVAYFDDIRLEKVF